MPMPQNFEMGEFKAYLDNAWSFSSKLGSNKKWSLTKSTSKQAENKDIDSVITIASKNS